MNKQLIILAALLIGLGTRPGFGQATSIQVEKGQRLLDVVRTRSFERRLEKAAYLGIASSPVSAALREQLKLKKGVGLVVERVEKDSPADLAGVKQYDIIEKMDDQWLINSEQFAALVRMQEGGNQVTLSVIRQSQPQTITVTLVEKEVQVGAVSVTSILGNPSGKIVIDAPAAPGLKFAPAVDPFTGTPKQMTVTSAVGQNIITINRDGDKLHLTANDLDGNQIFNGDVNTNEDWANVPPDIAREARQMITLLKLRLPFPVDGVSNVPAVQPVVPQLVQPAVPAQPVPVRP